MNEKQLSTLYGSEDQFNVHLWQRITNQAEPAMLRMSLCGYSHLCVIYGVKLCLNRHCLWCLKLASSSNTVQGSVLLPHYRTLEVRPGRIS